MAFIKLTTIGLTSDVLNSVAVASRPGVQGNGKEFKSLYDFVYKNTVLPPYLVNNLAHSVSTHSWAQKLANFPRQIKTLIANEAKWEAQHPYDLLVKNTRVPQESPAMQNSTISWRNLINQMFKEGGQNKNYSITTYMGYIKSPDVQKSYTGWLTTLISFVAKDKQSNNYDNSIKQKLVILDSIYSYICKKVSSDSRTLQGTKDKVANGTAKVATPVDSQTAAGGNAGRLPNTNFKNIALNLVATLTHGNSNANQPNMAPADNRSYMKWSDLFKGAASVGTGFAPEKEPQIKNIFMTGLKAAQRNVPTKLQGEYQKAYKYIDDWINKGVNSLSNQELAKYIQFVVKYSASPLSASYAKQVRGLELMAGMKVDNGVIGPKVRTYLTQLGYTLVGNDAQDITAYINDMKEYQTSLGVNPDGIYGQNTKAAEQAKGTNFPAYLQSKKAQANNSSQEANTGQATGTTNPQANPAPAAAGTNSQPNTAQTGNNPLNAIKNSKEAQDAITKLGVNPAPTAESKEYQEIDSMRSLMERIDKIQKGIILKG